MLPISSREDSYGLSSVLVSAGSLSRPPHSGAALAPGLACFSAFPLTRRGQGHHASPYTETPQARRLSRLSTCLHCLVEWRVSICSCASLVGSEKSPRSP